MTSRERLINAINRIQPDKIPIDLGASTVTGISAIAYNKLKTKMGLDVPTRVFDVVQQVAQVDHQIIDSLLLAYSLGPPLPFIFSGIERDISFDLIDCIV